MTTNLAIVDTDGTHNSWVEVWPGDIIRPEPTSSLNYAAGAIVSNMVTSALGTNGAIQIYNTGSDTVDFVIDVEGWYAGDTTDPAELDEASLAGSQDPTVGETTQTVNDTECAQDVQNQLAGTTATSSDISDAVSQVCSYDLTTDSETPGAVTVVDDSVDPDPADGLTITDSEAEALTAADGTSLAAAAKKRAIYGRSWSQWRYGLTRNWKETNSG